MPLITNISRCSLNDGPGIRTVVFLKGCDLKCKWCHNPECISFKNEISYLKEKCIFCGRCIEICPEHHIIKDGKMVFLRENCLLCGKCTDNCPSSALTMIGKDKTAKEVFDEIKKDIHYFSESNGGVTLSGGECLLFPDFALDLFKQCKNEGINTAIETSLFVPWESIEKVIDFTDLFFADLKLADNKKHIFYTGQSNELILENMKKLLNSHKNVIIRIPLIPNVNDTTEEIVKIAEIINNFKIPEITVELLRYNYMAEKKYLGINKEYISFGNKEQDNEKFNEIIRILKENVKEIKIL